MIRGVKGHALNPKLHMMKIESHVWDVVEKHMFVQSPSYVHKKMIHFSIWKLFEKEDPSGLEG
jgi:hypothetical protein